MNLSKRAVPWRTGKKKRLPLCGIYDLIEHQISKTPESIAVSTLTETLTYTDLKTKSAAWAAYLLASGVKSGQLVGVAHERSGEMVCAILGILRAGCTYVPLDPQYPKARLEFIARDASLSAVVGDDAGWLRKFSIPLTLTTSQASDYCGMNPARVEFNREQAAYIIYTSGSTGQPKGVKIKHSNAVNLMVWAQHTYQPREISGVLAGTSICFDLSIFEMFAPLCMGGTLILVPNTLSIADITPRLPVSLINTVPSVMKELIRLNAVPRSVKTINLAGELLTAQLVKDIFKYSKPSRLLNLYGPSETTTYSTCGEIFPDDTQPSIGEPIFNTTIYLLDESMNPVSAGEEGEIYIGGAGVASGYLNRPEMTRNRFIPAAGKPDSLIYKTGDRGIWHADGKLHFLGRLDNQIKLRGFRIEPMEIEETLRRFPGVLDAAVVAKSYAADDRRLAAFLLLDKTAKSTDSLRKRLAKQLPEYLVPNIWVRLEEFPRTANGKLDRSALESLPLPGASAAPGTVKNSVETPEIVDLIEREFISILNIPVLDRDTNVFEIGCDSFLAARIIARLRDVTGKDIAISAIYRYPTIHSIAEHIESLSENKPQLIGEHSSKISELPLTASQRQLWLFDQIFPNSTVNNVSFILNWEGSFNLSRFNRACSALISRHAPLRAEKIEENNGLTVFKTMRSMQPLVRVLDVNREHDLDSVCETETSRPFDLTKEPPWRVLQIRLAPQKYRLVITLHHILIDAYSIDAFLAELAEQYNHASSADDALHSYRADYLSAESELRKLSGDPENNLNYWSKSLGLAQGKSFCLTDRLPHTRYTFKAARVSAKFEKPLLKNLQKRCALEKITPYELLLTAFVSLLYRWSGQDWITVGSTFSLRDSSVFNRLLGFYANVLPLSVKINDKDRRKDLLQRTVDVIRGAHAHKHCAADLLQREIARVREDADGPIYPVMFGVRTLPAKHLPIKNAKVKIHEYFNGQVESELNLQVLWDTRSPEIILDFNTDIFSRETAEWLVSQFITEVENFTENLDVRAVTQTGFSSPVRRGAQSTLTIIDAFEAIVEKNSGRPAIKSGINLWTYEDLRQRVLGIAQEIREKTGDGENPVGILVKEQIWAVAGLLGVLYCGRPFVPLNPDFPALKLREIAAKAGITSVLTDIHTDDVSKIFDQSLAVIDIRTPSRKNLDWKCPAKPDSFAYALFTSGSSGSPKGVVQNHRNIIHHIKTYAASLGLTPKDRLTLLSSFGFDAGIMDIFASLLTGASLHIWSVWQDGLTGIHTWICNEKLTIFHSTPSLFRNLAGQPEWQRQPASLRFVVLGGEAVRKEDWELFQSRFDNRCTMVNGYGPTESTLITQSFLKRDYKCPGKTMPIGYPVDGTQVELVTPNGNRGVLKGEIVARSPHIFLGYLKSPDDWERLKRAPASTRIYPTGDMGRILPDGQLLFLGRLDTQLKINGIRVEPAEIEQAILAAADVAETCVTSYGTESGSPALVAYVVAVPPHDVNITSLRGKLFDLLPRYMVPNVIIALQSLPRLANNKIDYHALRVPEDFQSSGQSERLATFSEQEISEIWQKVLGLEKTPQPDAEFFLLGGHSLAALKVISEIKRRFNVTVTPEKLIRGINLRQFAEFVDGIQHRGQSLSTAAPDASEKGVREYALTAQQWRFWFLEQANADSPPNLIFAGLKFKEKINEPRLQKALDILVSRHDILRSRIIEHDRDVYMHIDPPGTVKIIWNNYDNPVSSFSPSTLPEAVNERLDLRKNWSIRAFGFRSPDSDVLLLAINHIACDAHSVEILTEELQKIYESLKTNGKETDLPFPPQYAEKVRPPADFLTSAVENTQLDFWVRELKGAPAFLELPSEIMPTDEQKNEAERQCADLDLDLFNLLTDFAENHRLTKSSILLAAFSILLSKYSHQKEVVIGMPVSLRRTPEEEMMIGPMINTVAIRCKQSESGSFMEYVSEVRNSIAAAVSNSEVPFEKVVQKLAPAREPSRHPIFQSMFSYHQHEKNEQLQAFEIMEVFGGFISCDVALTVTCHPNKLHIDLDGSKRLLHPNLIRRWKDQYVNLLGRVLRQPDLDIATLDLLPISERHCLISTLNRSVKTSYSSAPINEIFSAQVSKSPDTAAIVDKTETVTYRELEIRANQIAESLRDYGVKPGSFVPVIAERSSGFVATLLGVMKAGSAFIPLDPQWSREMLSQAFREAKTDFVIASEDSPNLPEVQRIPFPNAVRQKVDFISNFKFNPVSPIYAMYTSGSTGRPKGAIAAHRGILNRFHWMTRFFGRTEVPVTVQTTASIYDSSVWQLLWPLTVGGRAVIPGDDWFLNMDDFTLLIKQHGINVVDFVPSVLSALLPNLERQRTNIERLKSVRWLILGGEALSPSLTKRIRQFVGNARITNLYGPTETSIGCVYYEITEDPTHRVPIGKPIPNVEALLLNEEEQLVPRGSIGEICLAGDAVGLGYLSPTDKSGFCRLSFPEMKDKPAYRTGDLGRWNEAGQLEFHGRRDSQIKIRGVRIETSAIQRALESHEAVERAAVTLHRGVDAEQSQLVAYVQLYAGKDIDDAVLRLYLRRYLPPTHLPEQVKFVRELPFNSAGKLDVSGLDSEIKTKNVNTRAVISDNLELTIRNIWQRVLGNDEEFDTDTNFFDAGGNSLLILYLQREFENALKQAIPVVDLFRYSTIRSQAEFVKTQRADSERGRRKKSVDFQYVSG
jgi:amino acid adenylation domain-containing protein